MPTSSKDLWTSALEKLTESDRQQLAFYDGRNRLDILSDLQVLTESAKEQCIKKRWRFSRLGRNGETVVLRDIFNKMVVWINMFKAVGDLVVQYDPGHAALPWAGVRFILQVAVGDIVKFDFLVEGAESMARMIGRYAIFEDIYLRRASKAPIELEDALVGLYSAILVYQSKAKSFFDQRSAKRIIRSTFVTEEEFKVMAKRMDLEQSNVDHCATILDAENRNNISDSLEAFSISQHQKQAGLMDLLHTIDGPIHRMSSQLHLIEDSLDKSKRDDILQWLSAQPYPEHHERISKTILAGTGRWLLEDPTYADWHKGSASSLLWLHGKIGAGKSTLVSIVIEDAMGRFKAGQSPPPAYFYCSRNAAEPERSDPAAILSSIVRQLSCAETGLPLLPPVVEKYVKKGQGFNSRGLQIEESRDMITKLIEYYPVTTIVIDALDECDTGYMVLDVIENLLQNSSLGLLKVFLSSRDDQDISCSLREYPNLDLVPSRNSADIEAFVRDETHKLVKRRRLLRNSQDKETLKTLIIDRVSRGADGMFKWASLQLELLCTMKLDQDVRAKLGELPPKLEQLYLEIYEKNLLEYPGEFGQSAMRNIMKWLLCAQRPMKSSEFCTAVAMNTVPVEELTKEHVLDLCHNFVVFDEGLDVFRFAHVSVREFLEKRTEYSAISCHVLAAETCLLQFLGSSKWSTTETFLKHHYNLDLRGKVASTTELSGGFHNYANFSWARHCQLIEEEGRRSNPRFEQAFRFFLSDASNDLSPLNMWIQSHRCRVQDHLLQRYLNPRFDCMPEDRIYFVACAYGFCEILRAQRYGKSPRHREKGWDLAADKNEREALKLLLSNRDQHDISVGLVARVALNMDHDTLDWVLGESKIGVTKLVDELVVYWENGMEIVEKVMARYKTSEVSRTLLEYAARFASRATFESLLSQSDDTAIPWGSFLEEAGHEGNLQVMILLLGRKDLQITPGVMRAIAKSADEKVMQLLLEREDCGEITSEVINAGVLNRNEKALGLLLDRVGFSQISTEAISRAIGNCNEKVLSLLLDHGYQMSQTLVHNAASYGFASTLRLLIDRGGLITCLVLKCTAGNDFDGAEMMSLLLAEAKDWMVMEEMTEMMKIAAQSRDKGPLIMRLLLERAGGIRITEDVLQTAVMIGRRDELIKMFSGREWEMTEEVLEAMMSKLASEETMQLVLDRLKDQEITEKILLAAARNRSFGDKLVGLLLDRVDLSNIMNSLLVEAAENLYFGLEMIVLLQRRAGNINVIPEAVERAALKGSVRTMTFLLDHTSAPITEAVVVGALMSLDLKKVQLVLNRATDLLITGKMVHTAARYSDVECLAVIWERACRGEIADDITRDLAQAAMLNIIEPKKALSFLLDNVEDVVISPKALASVTRESLEPVPLFKMLLDRGINLQITHDVLQAAAANPRRNRSLMTFLLERSDEVMPSDDIFKAAAGCGAVGVLEALSKHLGLAEVPKPHLDLVRLHSAIDSSPHGHITGHVKPTPDTDPALDLINHLLAQGVDPDVPDGSGQTPSMHAALSGHILTLQALLSAGADPESQDRRGRTPLFFAAYAGHYGIVEMLLARGVSMELEDAEGETAASMARQRGHMRVFRLLEGRRRVG